MLRARGARAHYERGVALLRELGARYYLAWQLVDLAEVCLRQRDCTRARALIDEGAETAGAVDRREYLFKSRVLSARLHHAEGQTGAAREALCALLSGAGISEQAQVHDALWELGAGIDHAGAALRAYRRLPVQTPSAAIRARIDVLSRALGA